MTSPGGRDHYGDGTDHWRDQALCAQTDPEMWFPDSGCSASPAKKICRVCPVQVECLADALLRDDRFGVLGGLSERERYRLKKPRKAVA